MNIEEKVLHNQSLVRDTLIRTLKVLKPEKTKDDIDFNVENWIDALTGAGVFEMPSARLHIQLPHDGTIYLVVKLKDDAVSEDFWFTPLDETYQVRKGS